MLANKNLIFVIHKHAATTLHFDLRLEWGGVLKSWAIPKGPSYNSQNKRLAIEVADHNLDYATFEDSIPDGHYGAGPVMLWDRGTWVSEEGFDNAYKNGKIIFFLQGEKLFGKWALLRIRQYKLKNHWLFIKVKDQYDNSYDDMSLLETRSVKSGLSLEEIVNSNCQTY